MNHPLDQNHIEEFNMIDLHTSVEQKNREKQELDTDLYSVGWRNGLRGAA
ncbi:conserved hypothetical protein [Hyella patelloides LEGE 07179]|uniref:Uncharacterized protein n=1 Tax=Hyella patelloides LEGE 07179 TaxID=945734 RepID=A0A563VXR3_9CYAN|nr:conserved hypothetical protein [Hyella patelloides LEGE 07179]